MTAVLGSSASTPDRVRCGRCRALVRSKRMARPLGVCPECGGHSG
jgi:DNA-directed RNA polymerase subunit RPC12/RpoP